MLIIFITIQFVDLSRQYLESNLNLYRSNYENNEIIDSINLSFENLEHRLYIYPPDNCDEDYDMYLFAKEFIKYGGSIDSSRLRGADNFKIAKM